LVLIAIANEKATAKTLEETKRLAIAGRGQISRNLRNAEVIESMGILASVRKRWLMTTNHVTYV
jgi:ATP-binding cassette subfamily C protein EexD